MKYFLKLWGSCAYVTRQRFNHAWLTPKKAELCIPDSRITAPDLRELSSFVKSLPTHCDRLKLLLHKAKQDKIIEWHFERTTVSLRQDANARKIIAQFTNLLSKIEPLLELAEVIIKQVECRPLKTDTSVRFIGYGEIDGLSIEQWLAVRKEAGTKIDPNKAEVDWAYAQTLDPYGVYGELPEICQQVGREHFARSPGSDVWVWFGDLPDATHRAICKRHSK
jgi:hypothetical protein